MLNMLIVKKDSFLEFTNLIALRGIHEVKQCVFKYNPDKKELTTVTASPSGIIASKSIFKVEKESNETNELELGIENFNLFRKIISSFKDDYVKIEVKDNYLFLSSTLDKFTAQLIMADPKFIISKTMVGFDENAYKKHEEKLSNRFFIHSDEKDNFLSAINSLGSDDLEIIGDSNNLAIVSNKGENKITASVSYYEERPKEAFKVKLSTLLLDILNQAKTDLIGFYITTDNPLGVLIKNPDIYEIKFIIAPIIEGNSESN